MNAPPALQFDHAVVAAATLEAGVAWCARTLGVAPTAGGAHGFMATHNRILRLGSTGQPNAYLEIIAIDPSAAAAPARPRWFGLDEPALQSAVAVEPRLVHWVARCRDIDVATAALRALGIDPGAVVAAERRTDRGLLRWRISLRGDGRPPGGGAIPALIEWGDVHPCDSLPACGVFMTGLVLGRAAAPLAGALAGAAVASSAVRVDASAPATLRLALDTCRGPVILDAWQGSGQ